MALTVVAQANCVLIRRLGPARVLIPATTVGLVSAATLVVLISAGAAPVPVPLVLACSVANDGLSMPNSQGLALARHGHRGGTAAALMGCCSQFAIAGAVAPLVGLGCADGRAMTSAMPAATVLAAGLT